MKRKRGRPPIHPDARKVVILRFRVDADLAELLDQVASDCGQKISQILRDGIEANLCRDAQSLRAKEAAPGEGEEGKP